MPYFVEQNNEILKIHFEASSISPKLSWVKDPAKQGAKPPKMRLSNPDLGLIAPKISPGADSLVKQGPGGVASGKIFWEGLKQGWFSTFINWVIGSLGTPPGEEGGPPQIFSGGENNICVPGLDSRVFFKGFFAP